MYGLDSNIALYFRLSACKLYTSFAIIYTNYLSQHFAFLIPAMKGLRVVCNGAVLCDDGLILNNIFAQWSMRSAQMTVFWNVNFIIYCGLLKDLLL